MSLLNKIKTCNNGVEVSAYLPFVVLDTQVGWIHHDFLKVFKPFGDIFIVDSGAVRLVDRWNDYQSLSFAIAPVLRSLSSDGWFAGWRDEAYPVGTSFYAKPYFEMERAAIPRFGVAAFGVHINGFVRDGDELFIWIARRADNKPTYPGMLDNMVAGGQPVGLGLLENVIKEAGEEAGVPSEVAGKAKPVGAISYQHEEDNCLKPDTMFVFDMEVSKDFVPKNMDGELASFRLLPAREVMAITADTSEFKFNCAAVNIDFFIRHGILRPEDPDYIEIQRGLHR